MSVFYTHFSFSCEINELFKCQRIRGQETPNEQLVTTTKRANNKNESSQEKTIKRFSRFMSLSPVLQFFSCAVWVCAFTKFKKQFTKASWKAMHGSRSSGFKCLQRTRSRSRRQNSDADEDELSGTQTKARSSAHIYICILVVRKWVVRAEFLLSLRFIDSFTS